VATVTGIAPPASGGFPSVVVLELTEPAAGARAGAAARPTPSPFLDQIGSAFYPPTVVTDVGREIEFLNSEGIMHNVHVADEAGETVFNLATPPGFESYRHALAKPGVYRVSCDIHPSMKAFIVAATSPYTAVADAGGRFEIPGVPPGSYRASVWSADESRRVTRSVEIGAGTVELDLTPGGG
jgi:plastocyanin